MSQRTTSQQSKGHGSKGHGSKGRESKGRSAASKRARRRAGGPNRTWLIVGAVGVVLVVALVVALTSGGGGSGSSSGGGKGAKQETAAVSVTGTPLPRFTSTGTDSAVGDTIPTLKGESFDGSSVTIGPNGKPQVVMFVAHWCPHCQAEVPRLVSLEKAGAFKGLTVSTVTTGTNADYPNYPPSAWLQREHWPFPVMADSPQQTAATAYGLPAFPYFVFADAQGKVVGRADGEIDPGALQKLLAALAAGQALPSAGGGASSSAG